LLSFGELTNFTEMFMRTQHGSLQTVHLGYTTLGAVTHFYIGIKSLDNPFYHKNHARLSNRNLWTTFPPIDTLMCAKKYATP
jgi:hypothetical protein